MTRLVVISNRVPNMRSSQPAAGGLAVALLGALEAHGGLWFGWSGTVTEETVTEPHIETHRGIDFATLPLSRTDYERYYLGYANEVLWPVCHYNLGAMDYRREYAESYRRVNELFADALVEQLQGDELIWAHDYHLIPLARELRRRGCRQRMSFYLHIPFPAHDLLRAMPGFRERLRELCEYDHIGFQTSADQRAFIASVVYGLGGILEAEGVLRVGNRRVRTGVYPVGIDVDEIGQTADEAMSSTRVNRLLRGLDTRDLVVGVDRLDYSKGLPQRFQAIDALLSDYPHRQGHTVFMQIASPSREAIPEYESLRRQLEQMTGHINGRFADLDWMPIHYLHKTFARGSLMGLYRSARAALITPLRDGMNLVAKEFVAAQDSDNPGVLVLSELAGAAEELDAAIQVNPYDVDAIAAGLNEALAMPLAERRERHEAMMSRLRENNLTAWRQRVLRDLEASEPIH